MSPTLMRGVTHDGSFFGMFGSYTRAVGRFMDVVWYFPLVKSPFEDGTPTRRRGPIVDSHGVLLFEVG